MADEYISGEEYERRHQTSSGPPRKHLPTDKLIGAVAIVVMLCGLSFIGGMVYQKQGTNSTGTQSASANGGFPGRQGGFRQNGSIGQVTAVSDTSITVNDQRSGDSKAYTINSSTAISDNGQTVQASNIKTGDTVLVTTSSDTSTTATRILVNPSFDGGAGGAPDQSQSLQ